MKWVFDSLLKQLQFFPSFSWLISSNCLLIVTSGYKICWCLYQKTILISGMEASDFICKGISLFWALFSFCFEAPLKCIVWNWRPENVAVFHPVFIHEISHFWFKTAHKTWRESWGCKCFRISSWFLSKAIKVAISDISRGLCSLCQQNCSSVQQNFTGQILVVVSQRPCPSCTVFLNLCFCLVSHFQGLPLLPVNPIFSAWGSCYQYEPVDINLGTLDYTLLEYSVSL